MRWRLALRRIITPRRQFFQFRLTTLFLCVSAGAAFSALAHRVGLTAAAMLLLSWFWFLTPIWVSFCIVYFEDIFAGGARHKRVD